jgi:predicted metalloprotease with PDZ domain
MEFVERRDPSWLSAAALMTGAGIIALALFLAVRPLQVETPASASAQALLRLDSALGATVERVDHRTAATLGLRSADSSLVVTSVASSGPAAAAGLHVGDVIERIGGRPAGDQLARSSRFPAAEPLAVWRGGKPVLLSVQIGSSTG